MPDRRLPAGTASGLALAITAALHAAPAHAGLINDYSQSDDVWNTPIGAGKFLIDARAAFTTSSPSTLMAPALSLVAGLGSNVEAGLWGAYTFSDPGGGNASAAPAVLNPYLKWQLPWSLGGTAFGLVAGAQVPLQAGTEHNVALEGVAIVPLTAALGVDVNLGAGRNFVTPATLGHFGLAAYYSLGAGHSLLAEGAVFLTDTTPSFFQHLGYLIPLSGNLSADVGVAANETATGLTGLTPQVGITWTLL